MLAGAVLVLVCATYLLGLRSQWNAHRPTYETGEAHRNGRDDAAVFDGDNGTHVWFELDDIVWKAHDGTDSGSIPPCLRSPGSTAVVEIGLIEVARPYGDGSYEKVLSLTCP
jgi:hypothetical protein